MAAAYVNQSTFQSFSKATSITVNYPSGVTVGDLLVICINNDAGLTNTITAPTGWTKINANDQVSAEFGVAFCIMYRIYASGASVAVTMSKGSGDAFCMRFNGVAASPIGAKGTVTNVTPTTTHTSTAITTTADNSLALLIEYDDSTSTATPTPSGWSAAGSFGNASDSNAVTSWTKAVASSGSSSGTTSVSSAPNSGYISQQIEIRSLAGDNPPWSDGARKTNLLGSIIQCCQPEVWPYSFVGGFQPYDNKNLSPVYENVVVDSPKPQSNAVDQLAAGGEWPVGWTLPILPKKFIPGSSVNNPAPKSLTALQQYAVLAQVPPVNQPLPINKPPLSPGIPGQSVDNPVPSSNALEQLNKGGEWPVGWLLPILPQKLTPPTQIVVADFVPRALSWLGAVVSMWAPLDAAPVLARNLSPARPGISVDAPVPSSTALEQEVSVSAWPIGYDLPVTAKKFLYGLSVDNPPVSSNALEQLASGGAWPSGWDLPLQKGKLSPGIPGQSVDNPAPSSNAVKQHNKGGEWPSGWLLPLVGGKFIPPSVDNPPRLLRQRQISDGGAWPLVDQPSPVVAKNLSPGIPGQSVDNPPAKRGNQLATGGEWPVGWVIPVVAGKTNPAIPGRSVDNPPPAQSRQPAWIVDEFVLPSVTAKFIESVDNPAPLQRGWVSTVSDAWAAPVVPAISGKFYPQPAVTIVVDNPPFSSRQRDDLTGAWASDWSTSGAYQTRMGVAAYGPTTPVVKVISEWIITARRRGRR